MIATTQAAPTSGYWVVGGRWSPDGRLPWPRAFGPFEDQAAAEACASRLADPVRPEVRYLVVAGNEHGARDVTAAPAPAS